MSGNLSWGSGKSVPEGARVNWQDTGSVQAIATE